MLDRIEKHSQPRLIAILVTVMLRLKLGYPFMSNQISVVLHAHCFCQMCIIKPPGKHLED